MRVHVAAGLSTLSPENGTSPAPLPIVEKIYDRRSGAGTLVHLMRFKLCHAKSQERPPAMHLAPVLTPHGLLVLDKAASQAMDASALSPQQSARLERAFARGSGHGLLCLGADEVGTALPATLSYWRELGARYVSAVCALPEMSEELGKPPVAAPTQDELERMASNAPPMSGAEYVTAGVIGRPVARHRHASRPHLQRTGRRNE